MAGLLGVITRLRNPLLAPLRDSPKPRPEYFYPSRVPAKAPEAKLKGVAKAKGLLPEPAHCMLTIN